MMGRCFRLLCLMGAGNWGGKARAQAEGKSDLEGMCGFSHREFKFEGEKTMQRGGVHWEFQRGQGWRGTWNHNY